MSYELRGPSIRELWHRTEQKMLRRHAKKCDQMMDSAARRTARAMRKVIDGGSTADHQKDPRRTP